MGEEQETTPSARPGAEQLLPPCCPIVELRQYTLHPGQRDVLIDLFDREFIETQEVLGMTVIGQFRDLDDPNRFVWLRGFQNMPSRAQALAAFYGGPVWKAHRDAANATMIDSDNVLLLRPAFPDAGFSFDTRDRPPVGAHDAPRGLVVATVSYLQSPAAADFAGFFNQTIAPLLVGAGASIVARFVTESHPNDFPALPVREGEQVFVWFSRFPDRAAYDQHLATLTQSSAWRHDVSAALAHRLKRAPEVLTLSPTARSVLHG